MLSSLSWIAAPSPSEGCTRATQRTLPTRLMRRFRRGAGRVQFPRDGVVMPCLPEFAFVCGMQACWGKGIMPTSTV